MKGIHIPEGNYTLASRLGRELALDSYEIRNLVPTIQLLNWITIVDLKHYETLAEYAKKEVEKKLQAAEYRASLADSQIKEYRKALTKVK